MNGLFGDTATDGQIRRPFPRGNAFQSDRFPKSLPAFEASALLANIGTFCHFFLQFSQNFLLDFYVIISYTGICPNKASFTVHFLCCCILSKFMFNSPPLVGRMADDHYDIPWEFKNRALAAVVGQQMQHNKKRGERAMEMPKERGNDEKKQQQQMVRKRMSLPQAMCNNALGKKLMGNGGAGRVREQRKKTAQGTNGNGTAPGTVPANEQFQFIQQPTATTSLFDSHQIAALFPCSPPSSSSASPCSSSSSADNVRAIPQNVPSSYRHGATPPRQSPRKEFPAAEQHKRAPTEQNGTSSSTFAATANNGAKLRNYPMVAMPSSATAKEVIAFCQRRQCPPALEELENLVHENLDRCHSEQILGPLNLGAHLLRRRPDRNLALSLRAKEEVLHIKLEFHDGQWILGDGPRFSTVHGMLRAYRRTELPVRGAEQIRLGVLLKPSDIPGGLLLL